MIIDILFVGILVYGFYTGYANGIIKTIFTVISIAFGFLIMVNFSEKMTEFLISITNYKNGIMPFIGMAVTFLITMIILRLIGRQIENIFRDANINIINQIIGGAVMAVLFTVVFSVILVFLERARLLSDQVESSKSYPILQEVPDKANVVWVKIWPQVEDFWFYITDAIDGLNNNSIEENIHIDDNGGEDFKIRDIGDDE